MTLCPPSPFHWGACLSPFRYSFLVRGSDGGTRQARPGPSSMTLNRPSAPRPYPGSLAASVPCHQAGFPSPPKPPGTYTPRGNHHILEDRSSEIGVIACPPMLPGTGPSMPVWLRSSRLPSPMCRHAPHRHGRHLGQHEVLGVVGPALC